MGVMAVIVGGIAVNPSLRRRKELYSFIAASIVVGFAMISFYLFSRLQHLTDAAGYYGINLWNIPFEIAKYATNAWNSVSACPQSDATFRKQRARAAYPCCSLPFVAEISLLVRIGDNLAFRQ